MKGAHRATIMLVSSRLGWVRILLAALLCVVGGTRPVLSQAGDSSTRRGQEPSHVNATGRPAELVRMGERADDVAGDTPGVVAELPVAAVGHARVVVLRAARGSIPESVARHLRRARGPPVA